MNSADDPRDGVPPGVTGVSDLQALAVELRRMQSVPAVFEGDAGDETDQIVGQCPAMQEVYKAIGRVASP